MLKYCMMASFLFISVSAAAKDSAFKADMDHQPTGLNVELPVIDPVMWKMVWAQDFGAKNRLKASRLSNLISLNAFLSLLLLSRQM